MVANKKRLYVALYPSGVTNNEERKQDSVPGMRYHVKNSALEGWKYQELGLPDVRFTTSLLARILIAKVEDEDRLIAIFRSIPVIQNDPDWRCRTWLANALQAIANDGKAVGTSELSWQNIEPIARQYVAQKTSAGRYNDTKTIMMPRPTWDILTNRETVS
ncbi:hypothetical protein BJX70DRAFT_399494 [Aspergillus crustosus]